MPATFFLTSSESIRTNETGIQIKRIDNHTPTRNDQELERQETQLKSSSQAHLAIYDHLPRDINVLADSSKYQEWARKVLPRISSPRQSRQPQDGFVLGGRAEESYSDEGDYEMCLRTYSFKYNKHPLSSRTYKEHLKGRKVKPGLHRGSVTRFQKYFDKDRKYPKTPISSPVEGLERYETSFIHPRYKFVSTSQEQFDVLRKVTPMSPESLHKEKTLPLHKMGKKREKTSKCYFSFSKPAVTTATNNKQLVPYNDDPNDRKHKMPPIAKKTPLPSSMSAGISHGREERTIPSMHEMSRSLPKNIGPSARRLKHTMYTVA